MPDHDDHGARPRILQHPAAPTSGAPADERAGSDEHDVSLARMLQFLRTTILRRWRLVAAVWALVLLPVVAYSLSAVPRYTATGAVQVSEGGGLLGSNPLTEIIGGGSQGEIQTEVEILRRREFLVGVLTHLRLDVVDPNQTDLVTTDMSVALGGASPVNPRLRTVRASLAQIRPQAGQFQPIDLRIHVTSGDGGKIEYGKDYAETVDFTVGDPVSTELFQLTFSALPLAQDDTMELQLLPEGALLETYGRDIHVKGLGSIRQPTNIVEIAVNNTDREIAQAIVQTMMERYLEMTLEWHSQSASQVATFIERQLDDIRASLSRAEDRLKSYAQSENAVQLDTQAKVAIERAAEMEAQRINFELQERTISSVLARMRSDTPTRANITANFFDDPVLASSVQALTEAEIRYETLRASLTPAHPQVQELGRALELQKKEITRLMRSAQRNLTHQKKQVEAELAAVTETMSGYPDKQLELARLMRDMQVSERLYTLLLEKREEAEIMKASTTIDKRIVDAASLPHRKTSPQRRKLLTFGALGGLFLGVAAALGHHLMRTRLDTVEAIKSMAPLPTYGTVPMVATGDDPAHRLSVREIWAAPHEPAPEAFRALGVSVSLLPTAHRGACVITMSSSQPGEGKSTIASNLAMALGRSGKRVLLMDLDLRKPVQHRVWGLPRAPGYADLLGQGGRPGDLSQVAHARAQDNSVTLLTAGTRIPDTVAAIMSPQLPKMLDAWREDYDYIIVDAPPAFVAETAVLASQTDLAILVVRPGVVERANLRQALDTLGRANVPCGLVLNAVGRQHSEYYYGSGYYYYGSHYGEAPEGGEQDTPPSRRNTA